MKRLFIISIVAILAVCSMAQRPSALALWVIDGLVMDDPPNMAHREFVPDSIESWLERNFPLIKMDDIKEIKVLRNSDSRIGCGNRDGGIIIITTREDSGLRDLELNGVYTTKRKRIGLAEFSCKSVNERVIKKRWKIKNIKSIQIHPEGKTVVDRKGNTHTVFVSIETK